jgi:hypothetical protein
MEVIISHRQSHHRDIQLTLTQSRHQTLGDIFLQLELSERILLAETGQDLGEYERSDGRDRSHPQLALLAHIVQGSLRLSDRRQNPLGMLEQTLTGFREHNFPSQAIEESLAYPVLLALQAENLLAQGGLGHPFPFRGAGEAPRFRHRYKITQLMQFQGHKRGSSSIDGTYGF